MGGLILGDIRLLCRLFQRTDGMQSGNTMVASSRSLFAYRLVLWVMPACLAVAMIIGGAWLNEKTKVNGALFVFTGWCLYLGLGVALGYFDFLLRRSSLEGKVPRAGDHLFFFVRTQILVTPGVLILLHFALGSLM